MSNSFAGENIPEYKNTDAMGRGNSTISWSNSSVTNVFYNPSFLSEKDDLSFELIDTTIDVSKNSINLISHLPHLDKGAAYPELHPYFGQSYAAQGFGSPVISFKGFTLMPVFASVAGSAAITNPVFSSADVFYYQDYGSALAKGISVTDNLSLGLSSVFYKRKAELYSASAVNLLQRASIQERKGQTLSFNAGANYNFKDKDETVLGVNWMNIGSPKLWQNQSLIADEDMISSLHEQVGFGVSSKFFPVPYFEKKIKWSIEFRNLIDFNEGVSRQVSLGLEYAVFSWLNFTGGLYQSSPTFGLELSSRFISLALSTYGENSGVGYDSVNRHYIVGLKFGFDQDGK